MEPSESIDKYIAGFADWRGKMLANIRKIIHDADHEIIEEWKYMGSPVWYHTGQIVLANAYKDKVKLTFPQGANLPDPDKLFNNGLGGNKWRAIDVHEGDRINEHALKKIIRAAMAYNLAGLKGKTPADAHGIRAKVDKKPKKNMVITQKEHDEWHKKHKDYDSKNDKEHELCHREVGIIIKG